MKGNRITVAFFTSMQIACVYGVLHLIDKNY